MQRLRRGVLTNEQLAEVGAACPLDSCQQWLDSPDPTHHSLHPLRRTGVSDLPLPPPQNFQALPAPIHISQPLPRPGSAFHRFQLSLSPSPPLSPLVLPPPPRPLPPPRSLVAPISGPCITPHDHVSYHHPHTP
eukprot:746364-Hanusia_phi.AAC.8